MEPSRELERKVCVITGAGRGIGAATAERMAAAGGRIAVLDVNPDSAEETAREAPWRPRRCPGIRGRRDSGASRRRCRQVRRN